ncbi:MAG TPA: hypothetical protein VMT17_09530 [Anaeromyxobacteraceae bacterium]|nr:hypothetical protein [Anaeromyxobacteraceae bacterium]
MRTALAIAVSSALLLQGAAWAAEPVLCPMTLTVTSGHCECEHSSGAGAVLPRCCNRVDVRSVPSDRPARVDLAPPASVAVLPVLAAAEPETPAVAACLPRGTSPPLELLHRALLR